jgi:hypothetical protein
MGAFWLAALVYFLFAVVICDLVRLVNVGFHFLPDAVTQEYAKLKVIALISAFIAVSILLIAGHINATHPKIQQLRIEINKPFSEKKELKIVAISDIHLGVLVGRKRLERMVKLVQSQQPDMIVLVGDILDEVQAPIFKENIGEPLTKLQSPFGVYAIPGNHEYIGGIQQAEKYLKSLGLRYLRDSVVNINEQLVLIGRDDRGNVGQMGNRRKTVQELVAGIDTSKFIIMLDHQPFHLKDAANAGVDLQLSGHTHSGQFWPFNLIIHAIFELDHGYKKIGKTHFYVSSGFGSWGPPVRIGNRPEIVVIDLILKGK